MFAESRQRGELGKVRLFGVVLIKPANDAGDAFVVAHAGCMAREGEGSHPVLAAIAVIIY